LKYPAIYTWFVTSFEHDTLSRHKHWSVLAITDFLSYS